MVENEAFRRYLKSVKMTAKTLDRGALLADMRMIRVKLEPTLAALPKGQHVVTTHDGLTDQPTRTYMSTTYTFNDDDWELMARSSYCEKYKGNTSGDELAKSIEGVILKHE